MRQRPDPAVLRGCACVVGEPIMCERTDGTIKRSAITAANDELRIRLQACFDEAATRGRPSVWAERQADEAGQRV